MYEFQAKISPSQYADGGLWFTYKGDKKQIQNNIVAWYAESIKDGFSSVLMSEVDEIKYRVKGSGSWMTIELEPKHNL